MTFILYKQLIHIPKIPRNVFMLIKFYLFVGVNMPNIRKIQCYILNRVKRGEVRKPLTDWIAFRSPHTEIVGSICTGAALLARAGVLDGRRATTNKFAFDWVVSQGPRVSWVHRARWVTDGSFMTSSGVSAGIDMSLDIVARTIDAERARLVAQLMEYTPHSDANDDPFAQLYPRETPPG